MRSRRGQLLPFHSVLSCVRRNSEHCQRVLQQREGARSALFEDAPAEPAASEGSSQASAPGAAPPAQAQPRRRLVPRAGAAAEAPPAGAPTAAPAPAAPAAPRVSRSEFCKGRTSFFIFKCTGAPTLLPPRRTLTLSMSKMFVLCPGPMTGNALLLCGAPLMSRYGESVYAKIACYFVPRVCRAGCLWWDPQKHMSSCAGDAAACCSFAQARRQRQRQAWRRCRGASAASRSGRQAPEQRGVVIRRQCCICARPRLRTGEPASRVRGSWLSLRTCPS